MADIKAVDNESKNDNPNKGWFAKAHYWLIIAGGVYVTFVLSLTIPVVQRNAIFMHNLNFPFSADFATPELYGFAPHKTRNLKLSTPDGETLGAWHILPSSAYRSATVDTYPPTTTLAEDIYTTALLDRPTVLFLHGNAGNRALSRRVLLASSLSSNLDTNVLSLDYRGFGDSTGTPSEAGLVTDALTAFDWILAHNGGDASRIAVVGQSLGTGVGSALVGQLAKEGREGPRMLALLSPFESLRSLLETYSLLRTLPILSPLRALPYAQKALTSPRILRTQFDSLETLVGLREGKGGGTSILMVHAKDDGEIPHTHSRALFTGLLNEELGLEKQDILSRGMSLEAIERHKKGMEERGRREAEVVKRERVGGWGVVKRFVRGGGGGGGEVVWLETRKGGHDEVGGTEGVVLLMGRVWEDASGVKLV